MMNAGDVIPLGTAFTCEGGHYIGRAAVDIGGTDAVFAESFASLQGPAIHNPDPAAGMHGSAFGFCTCGLRWAAFGNLHTETGWFPTRPDNCAKVRRIQKPDHVLAHGPGAQVDLAAAV